MSSSTGKEFVDLNRENNEGKRDQFPWFLYFSTITADLLLITYGMSTVWSSSVFPKLQSNNTEINPLGAPITTIQVSTMVAIFPIAALVGSLVMAKVSDHIGRRKALICLSVILICFKTVIAFSTNIYLYYISRFINGFAIGGVIVCVSVYITEIAEAKNRATLCCIMSTGITCGHLLGYAFGLLTSVRGISLINAVPPLLYLICSFVTPDSPIFLVSKGNKFEALRVLEKLRRGKKSSEVEQECEKIEESLAASKLIKKGNFVDIFKQRAPRKGFLITIGILAIQQLSGIFIILYFLEPIFNEAHASLSGNIIVILVGCIEIVAYLMAMYFVGKVGKRPLLLFSSFFTAIPLFLLGCFFYLKHVESDIVQSVRWLPVICIVVYFIAYGIGLGPIPITLVGEFFPDELRAIGTASDLVIDNLLLSLISFTFPLVSEAYGVHCCFWFFSIGCIVGFVFIFSILPETKGKSFSNIQTMLSK